MRTVIWSKLTQVDVRVEKIMDEERVGIDFSEPGSQETRGFLLTLEQAEALRVKLNETLGEKRG